MSTTRTPGAAHKGAPSSSHCLLLAALAVGATAVIAGLGSAPVAVTAGGPSAPHAGPRITPEEAIALATGLEVGENDFRISDMGGTWQLYAADIPAVAYNSTTNEYLVVWQGDDNTGGLVDGEDEIFGQRINAATGAEVGANDFRISDMGGTGDADYGTEWPAVAYNTTNNEYLVVWRGNDNTGGLVDGEDEIFGQRLAADGTEEGANDFRISEMGGTGVTGYGAYPAQIAYNGTENEYLVVWSGDHNSGGLVNDEYEVFCQRLDGATGAELGTDFRISDMGGIGDRDYDAREPDVAYNATDNEYLVVWSGDDDVGGLLDGEREIFGQRLDGATGAELGTDFRISDVGGIGDPQFYTRDPAVAYNSSDNQYLVVWWGSDNAGGLVDGDTEVFGQRINAATGIEVGANDFRISAMGDTSDSRFRALRPAVAYNSTENEYIVTWDGTDNRYGLVEDELEVFGQRIDATTGLEIGIDDFRISDVGGSGDPSFAALSAAVAYNVTANEMLVVFGGDDDASAMGPYEDEILGQRLSAAGTEVGDNDFRISDMGYIRTELVANDPAVAYNSQNDEYLVVWSGDDDGDDFVDEEFEIFGQRIDAMTGEELGGNDFCISDAGGRRNPDYDALAPAVAYNLTDNQYLVVWHADDYVGELVDGEYEIWGQRIDAETGAEVAVDFRISEMGGTGDASYRAEWPAVAYNSTNGEYLVVWYGDHDSGGHVDKEYEIFGQRIDADLGIQVGTSDFPISTMGGVGDPAYDARDPAVAYNSTNNQYLVVWQGDSTGDGLLDNEFEIWGQVLAGATGDELGPDVRISKMGGIGNTTYAAFMPDVAYNSTDNQYLVVWFGDDSSWGLGNQELEIFGQRVDPTISYVGNYFRISDAGGTGDTAYAATRPAVAYNALENEYLVVWQGEDNIGGLVDGEIEIFGQRIDAATAAEIGVNDFRVSDMGGTGDPEYAGGEAAVACSSTQNEYLAVWEGDDDPGELTDDEFEVFGQRIAPPYVFLPLVLRNA